MLYDLHKDFRNYSQNIVVNKHFGKINFDVNWFSIHNNQFYIKWYFHLLFIFVKSLLPVFNAEFILTKLYGTFPYTSVFGCIGSMIVSFDWTNQVNIIFYQKLFCNIHFYVWLL